MYYCGLPTRCAHSRSIPQFLDMVSVHHHFGAEKILYRVDVPSSGNKSFVGNLHDAAICERTFCVQMLLDRFFDRRQILTSLIRVISLTAVSAITVRLADNQNSISCLPYPFCQLPVYERSMRL